MALRLFISYSAYEDHVMALRLQTLASVYGCEAYVPPAPTRARTGRLLANVEAELNGADIVLAVVNRIPSAATIAELNRALSLRKIVIAVVGQWVDRTFLQSFPSHFVLDPLNPAAVEQEIVEFLQKSKADKDTKQLVIGLAAVAVGLLLLSAVTE